ncbi:MAG TPA: sugar phosphate isomerase/epimerase family protein [Chthoniobacterales bacterium]|nr:sugar phosphate isomerase/epimerase family protein [Chthoniobacterales bacterium]
MYSRRDLGKMAAAALPLSKLLGQKVDGVQLGICTYSFRSMPRTGADSVNDVISAMKECGGTICELFSPQLEPQNPITSGTPNRREQPNAASDGPSGDPQARAAATRARQTSSEAKKFREEVRNWRLSTPVEHFRAIRKKFDDAGIEIYAYTLNFRDDYTDPELDKCFEQAKALDAKTIASSTQLSVAPRLARFAEKHKVYVSLHGHNNTADPNEFSSPETFQKALDMSDWFRINLDIGHFAAAGFDPISYIQEKHAKITHLHIKDRKKNNGPNEPFGEGDTPIKQVLALLKQKHYSMPALIEYEYRGTGTPVEEVKRCLEYERAALGS